MTVVRAYICSKMYETMPSFGELPEKVAELIMQAISINTSYTSRLLVFMSKRSGLKNMSEFNFILVKKLSQFLSAP